LAQCLAEFDSAALRAGQWARVKTFAASSGKVFPEGMKGAAVLTRWIARLVPWAEFLHQSFLDRFAARTPIPLEFRAGAER